MARQPKKPKIHISIERAGRLYRLLKQVSAGTFSREALLKKLNVRMRTFYRDVDLLRECGIVVAVSNEGYSLDGSLRDALHQLPFPDPELTFGDIEILMRGKSPTHLRLRQLFKKMSK
jgi:biotin operon repressor